MQTEAVVFEKPDTVTVRRIEMPEPAAGEVCLRTERSTISAGTEGWALRDLFTWSKTLFPCVPGYQRVGVIEALGPQVTGWQVGERVMATTGRWDGEVKPFWGAHAARANTAADQLFRLPEGIDPVDASGAVVAQVGYNAASRVSLRRRHYRAVRGAGGTGAGRAGDLGRAPAGAA